MTIIASPNPSTPPMTILECVDACRKANALMCQMLKNSHAQRFAFIWKNPKFTPEQIIAEFGTDAQILFLASSKIQELLSFVDSSYVPLSIPEEYTITFNPDGSANLIKDPQ